MTLRYSPAFWKGFIKAASPAPSILDYARSAPDLGPALTNDVNQTMRAIPQDWRNMSAGAGNLFSNLANQVSGARRQVDSQVGRVVQGYIPNNLPTTENLTAAQRKLLTEAILDKDEVSQALAPKLKQLSAAGEYGASEFTPEAYQQAKRLEAELKSLRDTVEHPAQLALQKAKASPVFQDLEAGIQKFKAFDQTPWYQKMTGVHNNRPYFSPGEYRVLSQVVGDPAAEDIIGETVASPAKLLQVGKDLAQTPNVGSDLAQLSSWVAQKGLASAPVAQWLAGNAPIVTRAGLPMLEKAGPLPAALGLAAATGGELGQVAGNMSVNGLSTIPKYLNEEMGRQSMGAGLGNYLLSVENNIHKPLATMYNLNNMVGSQVYNTSKDLVTALNPKTWQNSGGENPARYPAIPLNKLSPNAPITEGLHQLINTPPAFFGNHTALPLVPSLAPATMWAPRTNRLPTFPMTATNTPPVTSMQKRSGAETLDTLKPPVRPILTGVKNTLHGLAEHVRPLNPLWEPHP